MSYRIFVELLVDTRTAAFIKEFDLNLPQITIEAILAEISREIDIRKVTEVRTIDQEVEDLKRALTRMREERDQARIAATPTKRSLLQRIL